MTFRNKAEIAFANQEINSTSQSLRNDAGPKTKHVSDGAMLRGFGEKYKTISPIHTGSTWGWSLLIIEVGSYISLELKVLCLHQKSFPVVVPLVAYVSRASESA
jgi:hypothetical protein